MSRLDDILRRTFRWVRDQDTLELLPLLTSVMLLVHGGRRFWWVHVLIVAVVFTGIVSRPLLRTAGYWLTLTAILLGTNLYYYHFTDNHEFLFSYWCLALACCFLQPDPRKALAVNARWLIALVFLFATLWKLAADSFLDGSTLHFVMIQHEEYFAFANVLSGYTEDMAAFNRIRLQEVLPAIQQEIVFRQPSQMHVVAKYLSWITFWGEALIAIAFLVPERPVTLHLRNVALIVFAATVYPVVNVIAFGLILIVLGLAQCDENFKQYKLTYCVLFVVLACFHGGHLKNLLLSLLV